ncbi:putative ABC transporter ATP-binding protein YtfR [Propionispora sp. 2/2-37]|uniref:sugar ABC transporter ATP-binding protein n=1 Tax=Propionispora sp. 2/2-37 TaxID=1677858 RepID=UPI0006BB7EB2|nr:sugar ABC transporter ATP-binding protein [Propionispora sp. 2/2-37]CUH96308.1 putative ABC transporter ATP-binding protein YtfR [Propionispora sp. 2/2-37]
MADNRTILTMKGISKSFPGVKALTNVNFELRSGEIHCLMGENGAGKSTLIKVLTGVETLDTGEITLDGKSIRPNSPHNAQQLGISTVYQEVNLCSNLSVAENIFIGREPIRFGHIDWQEINKRSAVLLSRLNLKIDVTQPLERYSVAIQQMVAIARALDVSAKVLILDEPTSSLDAKEVEKLFDVMRKLKNDGMGIVFVTHFMDQVYAVSDRITVLRNGELVGTYNTAELSRVQLIAKMIGKEFDGFKEKTSKTDEYSGQKALETFLTVKGLGKQGSIHPFDLDVNKGEVLGFVGLLGSGRTEMARVLYGIDQPDTGDMMVRAKKAKFKSPADAIKSGMAFCPENRKTEGIIADLSVRENIILALQAKLGWNKYISRKKQEDFADKYIKLLNIKTAGPEQRVKNLSGGNQQKVILARWLLINPELLILDEPTRGIDIGTKAEIQKLILELSDQRMSVIFISSELDESLRCCSRMAVLRDRMKVAELSGEEIEEKTVMQTIAGV